MPYSSRHRSFAVFALTALLACRSDAVGRYSPEQDDVAMAAIASAWADPGGFALSLCEDVARSAAWAPSEEDCVVDHVVRGGGLGLDHVERHDGGCGAGGCPYNVVAWVVGTVSGPGFSGDVRVTGSVWLQTARDDDPYGYPYSIELTCDDVLQPCQLTGSLRADGSADGSLVLDPSGPGRAETPLALTRTGPASCP